MCAKQLARLAIPCRKAVMQHYMADIFAGQIHHLRFELQKLTSSSCVLKRNFPLVMESFLLQP